MYVTRQMHNHNSVTNRAPFFLLLYYAGFRAIASQDVFFFFFFQAEDGIRDLTVTGVQTCALPISGDDVVVEPDEPFQDGEHEHQRVLGHGDRVGAPVVGDGYPRLPCRLYIDAVRSEERRVGKECRSRWSPYH